MLNLTTKENVVKNFQDFLPQVQVVEAFLTENGFTEFMVVGSGALLACGLPINRIPHDIDLEVKCTTEQEKVFKAIADAQGNDFYTVKEEYPDVVGWEHKPYIFMVNGVAVNIWAVREFTHKQSVSVAGVNYATIISVLEVKLRLGRAKDKDDVIRVAQEFLNIAMMAPVEQSCKKCKKASEPGKEITKG